jgi:hypothetical protein
VERLIILSKDKITKQDVLLYVSNKTSTKSKLQELFDDFDDLDALQKFIISEYTKYKTQLV